jgi:hypothetical protein
VCEKRSNFQAKHPISNLTFNNVLNANFPKHTYLLGCNVETKISSPRRDMRRRRKCVKELFLHLIGLGMKNFITFSKV